jgi:hypothetical protein
VKKFKIRKFEPELGSYFMTELTMDEIIKDPYQLHMSDVCLILLNEHRAWHGLESVPDTLTSNVEYRQGRNEQV